MHGKGGGDEGPVADAVVPGVEGTSSVAGKGAISAAERVGRL